jgi:hypothetical protein
MSPGGKSNRNTRWLNRLHYSIACQWPLGQRIALFVLHSWNPLQVHLPAHVREPTNGLSGKGQPQTRPKPSNVQRKRTPGLTWSGCGFGTRWTLTIGRFSLSPLQSLASGILGPKTRTGNRLRLPVSGVRRECRGSVRGALPTVRTARAVWSFDRRMHSRRSQSYLLSRKHTSFILLWATDCNTLKCWSPRGRWRESRSPY